MKKRKILYILLTFALLLTVFAGCKKGEDKEEDLTSEPQKAAPICLFDAKETKYAVVRGNDASDRTVKAANSLREAIIKKTGAEMPLYDEYMHEKKGSCPAIKVGITGDEESVKATEEMLYDEYMFKVVGENLYIVGGSDGAVEKAVKYFIENYIEKADSKLELESDFSLKATWKYKIPSLTIAGNEIKNYKIVYDSKSVWAKTRADEVKAVICELTGRNLPTVPDSSEVSDFEILIGNTSREESKNIIKDFERPHFYYKAAVVDNKLCIASDGVCGTETAVKLFSSFIKRADKADYDLNESKLKISGDVGGAIDSKMANRTEGTDLRIMHNNVLSFLSKDNDNGFTDVQRAEYLVDVYLTYLPDVITFNEMHYGIEKYIEVGLKDYYDFTDPQFEDLYPMPSNPHENLKNHYSSLPIAVRKGAKLTEIESGYRYFSTMLWYHGISWTVLQDADGNRFMVLAAHLDENRDSEGKYITVFAEEVLKAVSSVKQKYGELPVVMNGDWFFWLGTAPYDHFILNGYKDASEVAKNQYSKGEGTYHKIGSGTVGVEEDICFVTPDWFDVLSHRIVRNVYAVNGSDHCPIVVDLRLKTPSSADKIPPYDDGKGPIHIEDEGQGGMGDFIV